MNIIFITINIVIAIMSGTAHMHRHLKNHTGYYDVGHNKSVIFDTLFDITYRITYLPVCLVCIGLALVCFVYGIYKYFDSFFEKGLSKKPLKCIGWLAYAALGAYGVWGMVCIILLHTA